MSLTHVVTAELNGPGTTMVDITADVDLSGPLVWTWGRTDWLSADPNPGTLTFTLDNARGDYTPGSPTGVYAVGCAEGVGVQWWVGDPAAVAGSVAAVGRTLTFRMGLPSVQFPRGSGGSSTVVVTATDVLARLATRVMGSMYDELVLHGLSATPAAYWPLREPLGAQAGLDVSPNRQPPLVQSAQPLWGGIGWGQQAIVQPEAASVAFFQGGGGVDSNGNQTYVAGLANKNFLSAARLNYSPAMSGGPGTSWTVAMWVADSVQQWKGPPTDVVSQLFEVRMPGWQIGVSVYRQLNGGYMSWQMQCSPDNGFGSYTPSGLAFPPSGGKAYLVALTVTKNADATVGFKLTVGGNANATTYVSGFTVSSIRPTGLVVGSAPSMQFGATASVIQDWTGSIHHVAFLTGNAADIDTLAAFGNLSAVSAGTEIASGRVARFASWLGNGTTVVQANAAPPELLEVQDTAGQNMLQQFSNALRNSGARFMARPLAAAPTATMSADSILVVHQAEWNNRYAYIAIDGDTQSLGNPVIEGNTAGKVSQVTATGRYGSITYTDPVLAATTAANTSVTAATSSSAVLSGIAQNRVAVSSWINPQPTAVTVDLNLASIPADWLTLTAGRRLRITNLPANVLGVSSTDHLVAGGTETYSLTQAELAYVLQPADVPQMAAIYDPASTLPDTSRFTADASCILSAVGASTINVLHAAGLPWSSSAADYPMLLNVSGECVQAPAPPVVVSATEQQFAGIVRAQAGTLQRNLRIGSVVDVWPAGTFTI